MSANNPTMPYKEQEIDPVLLEKLETEFENQKERDRQFRNESMVRNPFLPKRWKKSSKMYE